MDQLEIKGTDIYDGVYDFDATYFTLGELHTIKRISGLRRGEIADALDSDDSDLWVALAVIVIQRKMVDQGRAEPVDEQIFWDGRNVAIVYRAAGEVDARPPATPETSSESAGSTGSSGEDSTTISDSQGNGQPPTGVPSLVSVTSGQPT